VAGSATTGLTVAAGVVLVLYPLIEPARFDTRADRATGIVWPGQLPRLARRNVSIVLARRVAGGVHRGQRRQRVIRPRLLIRRALRLGCHTLRAGTTGSGPDAATGRVDREPHRIPSSTPVHLGYPDHPDTGSVVTDGQDRHR
jgi:hypothetical protein